MVVTLAPSGLSSRSRAVAVALFAALLAAVLAVALVPAVDSATSTWGSAPKAAVSGLDSGITGEGLHRTIVRSRPGAFEDAKRAVTAAGGEIGKEIPFVDSFTVVLSTDAARAAIQSDSVMSITLDREVQFEEMSYDGASTASNFIRSASAGGAWARGNLGQGVGVAVIDTGVSEMNDFAGRLVHGPDLSGEGRIVDTYGHGTVMAGIIGGSGADSATNTTGAYTGIAPKAHIVSVKVAGRNGSVDVSTMLQAMHWVSAYRDQYNIRVLNLSWGVASTQDPAIDPLNYAVQRLWQSGIVVVVAAGNSGPQSGTIRKPADDPLVISVGGYDDKQNLDPADDVLSSWSSRGPTAQGVSKPDILSPGRLVIASRSYGSKIEADNPKALVSPSYIRGSGTSQAAAVTSGVVALLLKERPELTPDQVKSMLKGTAVRLADKTVNEQGAGRVNLEAAISAAAPSAAQSSTATGMGSIEASRGGRWVDTDCGNNGTIETIKGEIDVRCEPWDPAAWTGTAWTGTAWTGTAWTGTAWTGTAWTGTAWTGGQWSGTAWTGTAWTGTAWTGTAWTGTAWTGSMWTGTAWTGTAWTGNDFTSAEYEEAIFLTSWWGNRPPPGVRIPGEAYTPIGTQFRTVA